MRRPSPAAIVLALAPIALIGAACQSGPRTPAHAGPAEVGSPFSPTHVRLHPLSRVDRDEDGNPAIVAYVELRDAWGHNTKAIGQLHILLYRPAGGPVATEDEQELRWESNLSDLKRNAQLFDPVTHMYRLELLEPPPWVLPEPGRPAQRIRLRIILNTFAPDGTPRTLEHDGVIGS